MEAVQETPAISPAQMIAIVRHRRWWIVLPLFVGWALMLAVGWLLPPKYKSETTILIEQQKVPEHYVVPNVSVDLQQRLQSLSQQILSRTRLLAIIDKFQLYPKLRGRTDPDTLVEKMRDDIDIELVRGQRPDELSGFKITYSTSDPVLAQQVAGELTSLFINENLRNREELSTETTAFLETQLQDAQKTLNAQEQRLAQFKSKYLGELPEQLQSNLQILSGLQTRRQATNDALNSAQQQRLYLESLQSQYKAIANRAAASQAASDNSSAPVSLPALEEHLNQLQSQLAQLTAKYTPQHPDVIRVKTEIEATEKLKRQFEAELASPSKSPAKPAATSATNLQSAAPLLQVESQLEANKLEISNRQKEIKQLDAEIDDYQHRLNLTPVREQEFASIIRDHDESQKNYESLLAKKLQSQMATNLERRQQGETFRVLDPPNLPQKPYAPNRLKFCLGGIAFGLALGLGLALLVELLNPKIHCGADVLRMGPAPLLVSIPSLPTSSERQRQRIRLLCETAAMAVMAMVISAGSLFTYWKG